MWVQEKEASRELQYHKVKSSDNSADLFAKAHAHHSIRRHTEAMGCEFMFGRDPIAFTVNNFGAHVIMGKEASEVENGFKASGRMDAWTRMDLHSKTYKTTNKGGPTCKDVAYRVTADARSGYIINIEDATNSRRDEEHRLVEGRPRDLVTVLLLKSIGVQDDHLGACDKQGNKR